MNVPPRVALFTDCYHETNGVANTMRRLESFAIARGLPMMCVKFGQSARCVRKRSVTSIDLARSPVRIPVDMDLDFDVMFARLLPRLMRAVRAFRPDVIHVTGPGDCGILGVLVSRALHVPLVASWHTNIHEFAARRLEQLLSWMPRTAPGLANGVKGAILRLAGLYYRIPKLVLAPNPEISATLAELTRRPVRLMPRGVDCELFHPKRRPASGGGLVFGYVGRLTPEKNVRLLADVWSGLRESGAHDCRLLVAGDGGERAFLEKAIPEAAFTGVVKGEALARIYAGMDVLLFPSRTDTFGNVVLEAQASGVPVLVTDGGGPKFLVAAGRTGWITSTDQDFVKTAVAISKRREQLAEMKVEARASALSRSWDQVFSDLYAAYGAVCSHAEVPVAGEIVHTR